MFNNRHLGCLMLAAAAVFLLLVSHATYAARWQMKQGDMHHTGRADFTVPDSRLNSNFFDVFLWQKPAPGSPNDGSFSSTQMTFF
ncbi:MAG: hypothetical protein ACUVRS_12620 [Armatimonadota bacterium]